MAYKFQLGAAVLSGSLTQEGDITGEGNITVANSGEIGCAADTDLITLANQSVAFANNADVNIAKTGGLQLGGVAVSATAAQLNQLNTGEVSSVSEIFKTDLKIGEDNQTKIDFEDENKINFYANNSKEMVLEENELSPGTNDGIALGSTSKGWSDLYLADSAEIALGNDQDVKIIHAADSGIVLQTAQDGNTGVNFKMRHSSSSPADNDIIGAFEFAGYNDNQQETTFAGFSSKVTDMSDGSEDAGIQLDVMVGGSLVPGILDLGVTAAGVVTIKDGAYDFDVASHDGTNGLKLGGTLVTADAGELNALDGFADASYDRTADSVVFFDATDSKLKRDSANDFASAIAGDGLTAGSGRIAVQVSGAIAIKSDKVALSSSVAGAGLEIDAGDVDGVVSSLAFDLTNVDDMTATIHQTEDIFPIFDNGTLKKISFTNLEDEIFGNVSGDATIAGGGALTIANDAVDADKLASNAVVNDSVASNAAIALSKIDTNVDMGGNFTIGNQADDTATFTGNLTVGGNLVVSGDTVTQNVANLTVEDPLIGLGYTDSATGSAGDRGLLLGLNGEQAPAMIWDESESQFAFVRTNSTLNATTVNINSYADLKVNSIEGSIVESITSGSNAAALSVGVNYFGDHGGAITANMPDNHSTVGQSVRVKAGSDCSATNKLTINAYGGQTIDGETEIVLESPFAAIEMVYVVSGSWRIF